MKFVKSLRLWIFLILLVAETSYAAVLDAVDDVYGIPSSQFLLVEALGVMENDLLDGESAGDEGVIVTLITSVTKGNLQCSSNAALALCTDGSFEYIPNVSFDGSDSFQYQAEALTGEVATATVTLTACDTGPTATTFTCWHETPFVEKLTALGYNLFKEGFEGSAWDAVRSDVINENSAPSILSKGITWTTNFPITNPITTGFGGQHSGVWGAYDPEHGLAALGPGNEAFCDTDNPPEACLPYDGLSGSGSQLFAAGAYISGVSSGASISTILDGGVAINIGSLNSAAPQFFGVIETAGFSTFQFREVDGKTGQQFSIFLDDIIIATTNSVPANNAPTLDPIGNQTIDENQLLVINLTARDLFDDGDFWSFSVDNLPVGAIFSDNEDGTATFRWRPGFGQAGSYPMTYTVTDNGFPPLSDFENIVITVDPFNNPPVLPVPNITANDSDGPLIIAIGATLQVDVSLVSNDATGQAADWWLMTEAPDGWYWYDLSGSWVKSVSPIPTYAGALFDITSMTVLNRSNLPIGSYRIYFGVDTNANGILDFDVFFSDTVDVTIQ